MIGDAGRQLTLRLNAYGIFYIMGMDNPLRESNNNENKKHKKEGGIGNDGVTFATRLQTQYN